MKVIDLLNKIANGEEVPKKFKFKGWIFTYDKEEEGYIEDRDNPYWLDYYINVNTPEDLSLEIEIIEEDNKIEKLEYNKVLHDGTEEADLPDEYYCEDCYIGIKGEDETNIRLKIINKINEIIDKLNKEEK